VEPAHVPVADAGSTRDVLRDVKVWRCTKLNSLEKQVNCSDVSQFCDIFLQVTVMENYKRIWVIFGEILLYRV
jgi:hypothetical protein